MNSIKSARYNSVILLAIPLILSAFTHLWNPIGFPSVYRDEDHYLRKTMHTLDGHGPQEGPDDLISVRSRPYDHPYFGPLFLAAVLGLIGYPDSFAPSSNIHSIQMLYLVPRVLMGLIAILDTFLIFRLAQSRYNTTVALIASTIFAVIPLTWLLRRIWLEPIQLPFLLLSILFAFYYTKGLARGNKANLDNNKRDILLILLSGIFLGMAIFTKIPAFTMIPLIAFIITAESSKRRNLRYVGLWFIPVILIPLIWPAYAISIGELDMWSDGILWQTTGRIDSPLWKALSVFFVIDPVILLLGIAGIIFATIKRDFIFLLWIIPLLILLQVLGYVSYWFFIPILPALCLGAAVLIEGLLQKIRHKGFLKVSPLVIVSGIAVFGLVNWSILIGMNLNSYHFGVIAFISRQIEDFVGGSSNEDKNNKENDKITVFGNNFWLWIPKYVIDKYHENDYENFYARDKIQSEKILFVAGENFQNDMVRGNRTKENISELSRLYNNSHIITTMEEKMKNSPEVFGIIDLDPKGIKRVEIRSNY
jgi:hypothetical protein